MRVLFDHNVDRRLRSHLTGHEIRTAREMKWEKLANGVLMGAAARAKFDAFLSIDQQPVFVLDSFSNALPALLPFVPIILELLKTPPDRVLYVIQSDGVVVRLTAPRTGG